LNQDLVEHAVDSLEIIRKSLQLVAGGTTPFYRVIAVQLRMLLCDSSRRHGKMEDISLLPLWLPGIRLHQLDEYGQVFSNQAGLTISEWLEQKLTINFDKSVTIRQLIRQVCDQDGGAHYDPKIKSRLDQIINYRMMIFKLGGNLIHAVDTHNAKQNK